MNVSGLATPTSETADHQEDVEEEHEVRKNDEHPGNGTADEETLSDFPAENVFGFISHRLLPLKETTHEQAEQHGRCAIGREPEVETNPFARAPLTAHQARHDKVDRTEHDHGEEAIESGHLSTEFSMRELEDFPESKERESRA